MTTHEQCLVSDYVFAHYMREGSFDGLEAFFRLRQVGVVYDEALGFERRFVVALFRFAYQLPGEQIAELPPINAAVGQEPVENIFSAGQHLADARRRVGGRVAHLKKRE